MNRLISLTVPPVATTLITCKPKGRWGAMGPKYGLKPFIVYLSGGGPLFGVPLPLTGDCSRGKVLT